MSAQPSHPHPRAPARCGSRTRRIALLARPGTTRPGRASPQQRCPGGPARRPRPVRPTRPHPLARDVPQTPPPPPAHPAAWAGGGTVRAVATRWSGGGDASLEGDRERLRRLLPTPNCWSRPLASGTPAGSAPRGTTLSEWTARSGSARGCGDLPQTRVHRFDGAIEQGNQAPHRRRRDLPGRHRADPPRRYCAGRATEPLA